MRLQVNKTVYGLVYKTGATHWPDIDLRVPYVLHVERLETERQEDCTVSKVLNNDILLAFVLSRSPSYALAIYVLDKKMVSCVEYICSGTTLNHLCSGLGGNNRSFPGSSNESELFLGHSCLLLLGEVFLEYAHLSLILAEHASGDGVLVVCHLLSQGPWLSMNCVKVRSYGFTFCAL